jgi:hypothetical protein
MTRKGTEWCAFDFELWSGECREACGCLAARRCHDWLVYTKRRIKKANTNGNKAIDKEDKKFH